MMKRKLFWIAPLFLFLSWAAVKNLFAENVQQSSGAPDNLAQKKGLVIFGIVVEKSSFNDIQKVFQTLKEHREGDASTANTWVCYQSSDGTKISFDSSEMGGGMWIDGIGLSAPTAPKSYDPCVQSSLVSKRSAFDNGLRLGSSRKEVLTQLGKPDNATTQELIYHFEASKSQGTEGLSIYIHLKNENADSIGISQTTSN
jgi:hypothetical protein